MDRAEKREFVTELNGILKDTGSVVVSHYAGLTVAQMSDLRSKMRAAGGTVKVAKNSLAKIALQGTDCEEMSNLLTGMTVLAYSEDPVVAPKVSVEFSKINNNLVILGGAMGTTVLDENGVKSLATMPSLDELRGRLIGMISTPATRIATVVAAPATQIARVLSAKSQKDDAAA